jgi:hypothetical protein
MCGRVLARDVILALIKLTAKTLRAQSSAPGHGELIGIARNIAVCFLGVLRVFAVNLQRE